LWLWLFKVRYVFVNREFQRQEYEKEMAIQASKAQKVSEEGEYEKMFSETKEDNDKVREIREKALPAEWKAMQDEILSKKALYEQEELEKIKQAEAKIRQELVIYLAFAY